MPVFDVQDPSTGKTLELEGDSAPNEQELEGLFAHFHPASPTLSENLFPGRIAIQHERDAQGKPVGAFEGALADVGDVAGAPSRALAALFTDQKMSDPNAYLLKGAVDAAPEVTKGSDNPYLGFSQPAGIHPKPVGEFVARTVSDPLSYIGIGKEAIGLGKELAGKAAGTINSGVLKLASAATKISPEALHMASTPQGREALKAAIQKEPEIAAKMVEIGNNPRAYIPEHDAVRSAESGASPIDIRETLQSFQDAMVPGRGPMGANTGLDLKVNSRIKSELNAMRGNLPSPQEIADMDFKGNLEAAKAAIADPESKWGVLKSIADKASKISDRANAVADQTTYQASKSAAIAGNSRKAMRAEMEGVSTKAPWTGSANPSVSDTEAAFIKARSESAKAKEAYANAVAQSATSGIVSQDAQAAKSALDAANKNLYLADATNEISQGKSLPQVARTILDRHGLSGEELQSVLKKARTRVGDNSFVPNYDISPEEFRKLKTSLGKDIQWDAPEAKAYNTRMQSVYGKMKDQLVEAVRSSQGDAAAAKYASDLDAYSTKIGDFKELNSRLGKIPSNRMNRAQSLINLHDKPGNMDLISRIEGHTGEDILQPAKIAKLAKEFGKEGKSSYLPTRSPRLGAALLAGGGLTHFGLPSELARLYGGVELMRSAASSPAIATKNILPTTQAIENLLKGPLSPRGKALANAFLKTTNAALQARIATQLEKEASQ